jgi:hypothetical protein
VQINAVCPGTIETPMVAAMIAGGGLSETDAVAATPGRAAPHRRGHRRGRALAVQPRRELRARRRAARRRRLHGAVTMRDLTTWLLVAPSLALAACGGSDASNGGASTAAPPAGVSTAATTGGRAPSTAPTTPRTPASDEVEGTVVRFSRGDGVGGGHPFAPITRPGATSSRACP